MFELKVTPGVIIGKSSIYSEIIGILFIIETKHIKI
jgi:hypothetical protein